MPRDSSGTYTLPAGNPVATLTVISSTWANTTLSDVSTAMTASLSRAGEGPMLAGLKLFDGAIGAPGLTWGTETTSGLYRAAAGDFRWTQGGVDVFTITAAGIAAQVWTASGAAPRLRINETDATANNRLWDIAAIADELQFRTANDADNAFVAWAKINRTLNVVDTIELIATTIAHTGLSTFSGISTFSQVGTLTNSAILIQSSRPSLKFDENNASANNREWLFEADGEQFAAYVVNDAHAAATAWLTVDRTGTTVDSVGFPSSQVLFQNGTAALPANSFISDPDTGMYRIGANNLGLSAGGTKVFDATATVTNLPTPLLQAQGIHNGTLPTGGTGNYIASGTYTPTISATVNLAATTSQSCQWTRVGSVVTVSGQLIVDCTTTAIDTQFELSLPIASAFTATNNAGGTGAVLGSIRNSLVRIEAQVANDTAFFGWVADNIANTVLDFIFMYVVLN